MAAKIKLLSTDFDGTLVSRVSEPFLDPSCMEMIRQLQSEGTLWAINTGRSVDLLESGLTDFSLPIRPNFILTSERDVFRPVADGKRWEAYGDWNERCARAHTELYNSASSVLEEVVDFVNQKTRAHVIYERDGVAGLIATNEEEMERVTQFIDQARSKQPKFHYQRNTVYLRFCHSDYHKGAALAELGRLLEIERDYIFAAGDHHNDVSMLDGVFAAMPACPANAIPEVKKAVRNAGGYIAKREHGAGVHEALVHFVNHEAGSA